MPQKVIDNLEQQLLIAMPSVTDELFKQTVIYVYEHDEKGAMAFVVNKSLPISVADILRQLNMEVTDPRANELYLLQGGPVSKEQLYIVQHRLKQEEAEAETDENKKSKAKTKKTEAAEQQEFALVQPQE